MSRLRSSERHGIVTSYDSKKYLAKVMLKPEDQETGWIPIETGHIGKTYGMVIGLQPGQGSSGGGGGAGGGGGGGAGGAGGSQSSDNTGDQVIVRFHEGDFESGKVVQRVHSDKDTPPEAKAGEIIIWTVFKKDSNKGPQSADEGQQGIWLRPLSASA
jgi:hypothetical protein